MKGMVLSIQSAPPDQRFVALYEAHGGAVLASARRRIGPDQAEGLGRRGGARLELAHRWGWCTKVRWGRGFVRHRFGRPTRRTDHDGAPLPLPSMLVLMEN
jgi:hypothetical protein